MNPWDIVSWVGATSVAIIITTLTITVVITAVKNHKIRNAGSSTPIYNSRKHD